MDHISFQFIQVHFISVTESNPTSKDKLEELYF